MDKILSTELALRQNIDFLSFTGVLPDPDPILRERGQDISVYRSLLNDPDVKACVSSRKAGVKKLEWGIDRGKARSRQAKIIEKVFNDLDLDTIISDILNAPLYGFQPIEVIWDIKDGLILPVKVQAKPPEWFQFDTDNNLRLKVKYSIDGELVPDKKFLVPSYNATYENPYGERVLAAVFWYVFFKKENIKFWLTLAEKYGIPWAVGKLPSHATDEERDQLRATLERALQDGVIVINDDGSIELIESSGKGASADLYEKLARFCNEEVAKAILGQTLSTGDGGGKGSYALGKAHLEVRSDIVDGDSKIVESTLNLLIKWIFELNFSGGERPLFSMWEEQDVDKELAERDKILVDTGIKFSKKYYMKAYGFDEEDFEVTASPPQNRPPQMPQQFSESSLNSALSGELGLEDLMNSLDPKMLQDQMNDIVKPVIDLVNNSNSFEEVLSNLAEKYPDMDSKKLEDKLAHAMYISELWGMYNGSRD